MQGLTSALARSSFAVVAFAAFAALATTACVARPQMCSGGEGVPGGCSKGEGECVAGRCLPANGGGLDAGGPEIRSASPTVRRIVAAPTEIAFVRPGDAVLDGALPALVTLGRAAQGDAHLLLRFSVPLTPRSKVVEAYLLLEQSDALDADPAPVSLHLTRVVDAWDARSLSWGRLPRTDGARTPETRVAPSGRGLVRIAATELVTAWRAHDPRDQGLALVASTTSVTGISFVSGGSTPSMLSATTASPQEVAVESTRGGGPRLEIYVK